MSLVVWFSRTRQRAVRAAGLIIGEPSAPPRCTLMFCPAPSTSGCWDHCQSWSLPSRLSSFFRRRSSTIRIPGCRRPGCVRTDQTAAILVEQAALGLDYTISSVRCSRSPSYSCCLAPDARSWRASACLSVDHQSTKPASSFPLERLALPILGGWRADWRLRRMDPELGHHRLDDLEAVDRRAREMG